MNKQEINNQISEVSSIYYRTDGIESNYKLNSQIDKIVSLIKKDQNGFQTSSIRDLENNKDKSKKISEISFNNRKESVIKIINGFLERHSD